MPGDVVSHRLDLLVRLNHAVTGNTIADGRAMFFRDRERLKLRMTNDADWVGTDIGRHDFELGVNVRGFEKAVVPVRYEVLDQTMPMVNILLIPEQTEWNKPSLLTLEGSLNGIEELQAVPLKGKDLYAVSYQEEDCTLSLYNPHKKNLRLSFYAIVDQKRQEFEIITVLKTLPDGMVKIDHSLKKSLDGRSPLVHPVYGMVSGEGRYLIRLPGEREDEKTNWILRYVVNGKEYFRTTDLSEPGLLSVDDRKKSRKGG